MSFECRVWNCTCTSQDYKHKHIVSILDKKPKLLFAIDKRRQRIENASNLHYLFYGVTRYAIDFGEYHFDETNSLYEDLIQFYQLDN